MIPSVTSAAVAPDGTATDAASVATSGFPVTIQNCGRTLQFDKAPERVVVAYQPLAEIMIALGLGDRIVGVQYGQAQEPLPEQVEAFAKLPWLVEPGKGTASKEVLIATQPDFVVVSYFTNDLDASTGAASETDYGTAGAQVYGMATDVPCLAAGEMLSLASIYSDILNLGTIFGVEERAETMVQEMRGQVAAIEQHIAGQPRIQAIYYEDGTGPYTIYGAGLATEMLNAAGAENVFADQQPYAQVGPEVVATQQADIWVITEYPGFEPVETRATTLFTTFPNMPAAQNKRSVGINGAEAGIGIRLPAVIEQMARAFHPDSFADVP